MVSSARTIIIALIVSETSQPLRKRFQQHTSGSSVSAVFDHLKASGHKTDLEEVKIIDRETRWFEHGVKEAIWVRAENPSLNRSGGVRIKLSHAWDRTIRTLPRKLTSSLTSDDVASGESTESRSTTSVPAEGWWFHPQRRFAPKNVSLVDKIYFKLKFLNKYFATGLQNLNIIE